MQFLPVKAPMALVKETKRKARKAGMTVSGYVREAVSEKNARVA